VLLAGCRPAGQRLGLHYLPGFVPGSQDVFHPAKVAVLPVGGSLASGRVEVGSIYDDRGLLEKNLFVSDAGTVATRALIRALADGGLAPVALDAMPAGGLPSGIDYLLTSELLSMEVNKRFGVERTVHGQYFTMESKVRLKFALLNRSGEAIYSDELTGAESEPPAPLGAEVFLPLETEPAESLSVALSRAIGSLMLEPGLRRILPVRAALVLPPTPIETPTSAPTRSAPASN
jgi:hypothetical protein